jgi:hypothetical protein
MTQEAHQPDRRQPPDRRKEDYDTLDQKIDERFNALTDRLARFISKALVGFGVLGIACALGLFGFGLVLHREARIANDIQKQRKATIMRSCKEQNMAHDKTFGKLILLSKQDENQRKTEAGKQEVRRRRDVTLGLIDALAPRQDCASLVAKAVEEEA